MRLSDAGLRRRTSKLIYLNHRPPPWLNEDDTPRGRSNRLLEVTLKGQRLPETASPGLFQHLESALE
jgi:hypothetical protein